MLKLNNTFQNTNGNFYKVLDTKCNNYFYLLVRTIDNPNNGLIQFIICHDMEISGKADYNRNLYSWAHGKYFDNISDAVEQWNKLSED